MEERARLVKGIKRYKLLDVIKYKDVIVQGYSQYFIIT